MNGQLEEAMAHQLGWVLYLSCLAIAVGWAFFFAFVLAVQSGGVTEMVAAVTREPFAFLIWFGLPLLVLYGIGRAFRYVLSNE
jgi:TRAP-type mannitol/chloroaromatic compound transport system permease small subunit